jgi:osmotically-inducible protein OsmY
MKSELELKRAVEHELNWDSGIEPPQITIEVEEDMIFLSGCVNSYPQKMAAERAALRVSGVQSVQNNITVKVENIKSDAEIKRALTNLIHWNADVPVGWISITVKNGWVKLDGEVAHEYQFSKAEYLAEDFTGVQGVTNNLRVLCLVSKNQ